MVNFFPYFSIWSVPRVLLNGLTEVVDLLREVDMPCLQQRLGIAEVWICLYAFWNLTIYSSERLQETE